MKKYILLLILPGLLVSCSRKVVTVRNPTQITKPGIASENILIKKYTANEYIERFKSIAITEMNASGIPASITLAQGLLESGNGNSTLAREANNHFGIKCTPEWKGKSVLRDDDLKNECFRAYKNPEESFRDHSEFLKRKHYAFLFELDKNDYKGWATGLKQAGYATNPRYPELLISLIERYQLDQFDLKEGRIEKIKREDKVFTEINKNIPIEQKTEAVKAPVVMKIYEAKAGDTLFSLSKRFGLTVEELKILNNIQGEELKPGQLLLVSK